MVANNAFKDRGGPVLRTLDALQDRDGRDRLADDGRMLAASSCDIFTVQSAADWRQKRDFVSRPQPRGGTRVLLIDRHGERRCRTF